MAVQSDLKCDKCKESVHFCQCRDMNKRLHAMAHDTSPGAVMLRWCRRCNRHFARCFCAPPYDDYVICGGKEVPLSSIRRPDGTPVVLTSRN